jgi:hypothetical protein
MKFDNIIIIMFAAFRAKTQLANMIGGTYSKMGFRSTQSLCASKKLSVGEYVAALETKISGISQVVSILLSSE